MGTVASLNAYQALQDMRRASYRQLVEEAVLHRAETLLADRSLLDALCRAVAESTGMPEDDAPASALLSPVRRAIAAQVGRAEPICVWERHHPSREERSALLLEAREFVALRFAAAAGELT